MGHRTSRQRTRKQESDESENEPSTAASSSSTDNWESTDRSSPENAGRVPDTARSVESGAPIQRDAVAQSVQGHSERDARDRGHVTYDPDPDPQRLSDRYGIDVRSGQARKLQRLETECGADQVRRWADEGIAVETMGKPRDMQAFRERQSERPDAVPSDIDRQNEASRQRNRATNRTIQPTLRVSEPDDPAEREADRVAEQVMEASDERDETATAGRDNSQSGDGHSTSTFRPSATPTEDQPPRIDESPRSGGPTGEQQAGEDVERGLQSTSGGKPLSPATRSFFEPRFGRNFGDVRVHTGGEAADLNRQLDAKAFTDGSDIYFGEGQYRPETPTGKQLLAHELTHVAQQTGGSDNRSMQTIRPTVVQRSSVKTTDNVNIREGPSLKHPVRATTPIGVSGNVVDGPETNEKDDYRWWKIEYDAGYTGWSAQPWLEGVPKDGDEEQKEGSAPSPEPESEISAERQWGLNNPGKAERSDGKLILWNFNVGSDELKPDHKSELSKFLSKKGISPKDPRVGLEIIGHASASGGEQLNRALAMQRAVSVMEHSEQWLDENMPEWTGSVLSITKGELEHRVPNETPKQMAKNRRVEFAINKLGPKPSDEEEDQPEPEGGEQTEIEGEHDLSKCGPFSIWIPDWFGETLQDHIDLMDGPLSLIDKKIGHIAGGFQITGSIEGGGGVGLEINLVGITEDEVPNEMMFEVSGAIQGSTGAGGGASIRAVGGYHIIPINEDPGDPGFGEGLAFGGSAAYYIGVGASISQALLIDAFDEPSRRGWLVITVGGGPEAEIQGSISYGTSGTEVCETVRKIVEELIEE